MKKNSVTNYLGEESIIDCMGCAFLQKKIIHPLGSIIETSYFEAHQDFEIPIPGFIIMQTKRHIESVDDFTPEEQIDYIRTTARIRAAMREVLKISEVYLLQIEETGGHFHLWFFPRYPWMDKQNLGRKIQSVRPIMNWAKENMKTEENIQAVRCASDAVRTKLAR